MRNVMLRAICAIAIAFALPLFVRADVSAPPRPTQWVTDTQNVLSAQTLTSVNNELRAYEAATQHRVIVYIGSTTGTEQLESWTSQVAEAWAVGRKAHDDGAILFVFMQDHKIRIEVGYGLEGSLTDAATAQIIRDVITPDMRVNNVDGAIQDGVDQILVTITPSYASSVGHAIAAPVPASDSDESGPSSSTILLIIIVFFALGGIVLAAFVGSIRYLWTLITKGPKAASQVWHNTWITSRGSGPSFLGGMMLGSMMGGGGGSGGGGFSGMGGGGFGGGFGGGGASGGW